MDKKTKIKVIFLSVFVFLLVGGVITLAIINMKKNEFHLKAGLSNGFLDKNSGITTDSLAKILIAFPDIDITWLLVGEELVQPFVINPGDYVNNRVVGDLLGNGATKTTTNTGVDERLLKMLEDSQAERLKLLAIIENLTSK